MSAFSVEDRITTRPAAAAADGAAADAADGVLLYYCYAVLDDPAAVLEALARASDQLVGRLRVSKEGVNATLGGAVGLLRRHVAAARGMGLRADFKLDAVLPGTVEFGRYADAVLRKQTGFDALRGRVVAEVVTYGSPFDATGVPVERVASNADWDRGISESGAVVLDVRNAYESAIGRFDGGVCPPIRNTADFADWLEAQPEADFQDRRVYAYCTGGVRCERAAQLVSEKFPTAHVAVLQGGVLGYLARGAADGAAGGAASPWRGRLFVFDPRVSVDGLGRALDPLCSTCGVETVRDYSIEPQPSQRARQRPSWDL
ncbi:Rhodanese-like domain-containing protein [Pelagophyceae sp. CCMP2097]|nr:Rhodanese-like domain-containing protein [Pelagophyceae sp. CCMP2097]